jgi:hypothetical protein
VYRRWGSLRSVIRARAEGLDQPDLECVTSSQSNEVQAMNDLEVSLTAKQE